MHSESASVDITSENIQNELRKIEELLEPYDPVDIMNFDETGLYYQQPPRRTICSESLDDLKKKSKARLTVGLLCNSDGSYKGQPIAIGQHKSPKCFKARLNVAFGRQNRKIALLLDNASVHKIRIPLNNIKLIFLLANTTSKLQALDAGIIDNFKAHFRAQQYDRALCLYTSKKLDNPNVYKIDQAQAMLFLANAWLKVKPETINGMLPDLPRNFDNKVTGVSQLNLEADESEMIVCYTTSTTNNEETAEGNVDKTEENDNTEQDEQRVDIVECKKRLREAYETILMYEVPLDDLDRKLHRRIRMRLVDSCAELNKSKDLEMHLYKQYLFKPQNVKLYSEQDFIVKFWSYVFEEAFSNSGLCLHWGDTKPGKVKKNEKIDMKIDLRVLYCSNTRGDRSIYLHPYSPELNPIEQFWSAVKNKVKRGAFSDNEDLKTRTTEACNHVPIQYLKHYFPQFNAAFTITALSTSKN
ncbi:hypothetical protein G6F48_010694 [Rhizopus delemar]|nr:hypothetical protein G6F48_010694 [Rhizopus delemar]